MKLSILVLLCAGVVFGQGIPFPGGGLVHAQSGGTPPAFVSAQNGTADGSQVSLSTGALSVTTGNMLWVGMFDVSSCAGDTLTSLTDNASNTYTQIGTSYEYTGTNGTFCLRQFYAKNVTGNASLVATITGVFNYPRIVIQQASNCSTSAPLDTSATGSQGNASSVTSDAFTTTSAAEIIFAFAITGNGSASVFTPDTGYTIPANANNIAEYKVVSSTQTSVTAGFSWNVSGTTGITLATFK